MIRRKIKRTILFSIAPERLGINLDNKVNDLNTENYKIEKKLKKTQLSRKINHVHGLEEYCSNFHTIKSNLQIQCNLHQNSNGIFHKNQTNNLNLYGNTKYPKQPKQSWGRTTKL